MLNAQSFCASHPKTLDRLQTCQYSEMPSLTKHTKRSIRVSDSFGHGNNCLMILQYCVSSIDTQKMTADRRRTTKQPIERRGLSAETHFSTGIPPQSSQEALIFDSGTPILDISANAKNLRQANLPWWVPIKLDIRTKNDQQIWLTW